MDGDVGGNPAGGSPPETLRTEAVVGAENLVSRWSFDGELADTAGGNDPTVAKGSPSLGTHEGRNCAAFDGDDALRVSRGGHGELSLAGAEEPQFCIATWVYFDSETGTTPFEGTGTPSHSVYRNDTGVRIVGRRASSDAVGVRFSISPYGDSAADGYSMPDGGDVVVPVAEWHHLAVLVSPGERVRIHLDGDLAFEDDEMEGYSEPNSGFWTDVTIGGWYGGNPEEWANFMEGKLADLRVYQPGITESQIREIAQGTSGGADSGVVRAADLTARWPFENGLSDAVGGADAEVGQGEPAVGTYDGRPGVAMDGDDGLLVGSGEDNPELSLVDQGRGPVTVTGWVYFDGEEGGSPNNPPADHHILRNDAEYVLEALPATDHESTVEIRFGISSLGGGVSYNTADRTDDELHVSVREWHHLAVVVNPAEYLTCYVDGREAYREENFSGYSPRNTNDWSHQTIGSWYGTGDPDWYDLLVGKLSDLRIYDGRLSAEAVARIYENGAPERATFAVGIVAADSPTEAGTEVSVEAEIENTGGAKGTQSIRLEDPSGTVLAEADVTLAPGATRTITLTWRPGPTEPGETTLSVVSADDAASRPVVVTSRRTPTPTRATRTSGRGRLRNANRLATVTLEGEDHYVLDQVPDEPGDRYAFTTSSYELLKPERAASVAISYRYCEDYTYDSEQRLEVTNGEFERWKDAEQIARTANLFAQLSGVLAFSAVGPTATALQVADLAVTTFDWAEEDIDRPYYEVFANIGASCSTLQWMDDNVAEAVWALENVDQPAVDLAQSVVDAAGLVDDTVEGFTTIAKGAQTVREVYQQADTVRTSVNASSVSGVGALKSAGYTVLGSLAIGLTVDQVSNAAESQAEIAAIGKAGAAAQRPLLNKLIGLEALVNEYSIGPSGILRMLALRQVDYQIEAAASYGISRTYEEMSSGVLGGGYDAALGADAKAQNWEDTGSTWENLSHYTAAATGQSFSRGLDAYQQSVNYEEYGPQSTFDY